MKPTQRLTAIIEREEGGFVALCPELDIASEGASIEEARVNLIEALTLFFAPSEVARRLHDEVFVTQVEVPVGWAPSAFELGGEEHGLRASPYLKYKDAERIGQFYASVGLPIAKGWSFKKQVGSHRRLQRPGWPNFTFSFHDSEELGPAALAKISKETGLTPEDL